MRFSLLSTLTLSLAATVLAGVAPRPTPAAVARRQEASPVTQLNIGGSLIPVAVITRFGTPVTVTVEASPTAIPGCVLHGDHWDCPLADGSVDHSGHDHSGHDHDHSGHSHAGHSHGPSEEYGCGLAPYTDQSIRLQIAAVFVLLLAASLGAGLPNILRRKPEPSDAPTSVLGHVFFLLKHFGTGIILSTAFVHLLFHAFIFMSNECIGTLAYEAASPAIAMGAVWLVFVVDFFVLRALRQRAAAAATPTASHGAHDAEAKLQSDSESASDVASQDAPSLAQAKLRKYDVLMLEAGIIFHSVIIGVTLGASNGEGWVPLFIAITFHQLFEGLALGARIALLPASSAGWLQKTAMCGAYALTTPLGIASGIGARRSFNTNDRSTLLALGILDSFSAGILLYTALVELIAGDFIQNKQMSGAPLARAVAAVTALTLGAAAMSVLALWA